jgi:peptidoglycan hydrolase-like protein with peptidoglycan-binding domain
VSRLIRIVGTLLAVVGLVGLGWWAGRVTLEPPANPIASQPPIMYTVGTGSVERSVRLVADASWQYEEVARNARAGIVTSIEISSTKQVADGDVLLTVDLRPMIAATGEVPAFRALGRGDVGRDVAQLVSLLHGLGYYKGADTSTYSSTVELAVKQWQRKLGEKQDGIVHLGDIVFLPALPAQIALDDGIAVGKELVGDEPLLRRALHARFSVVLTQDQAASVAVGTPIAVSHGDETWQASLGELSTDPVTGDLRADLVGLNGKPVCGDACLTAVPPDGHTSFTATAEVVPRTEGPVVPIAAIWTSADGSTAVTRQDGSTAPVTIRASSGGMAVVSGIAPGDVVLLSGTSSQR